MIEHLTASQAQLLGAEVGARRHPATRWLPAVPFTLARTARALCLGASIALGLALTGSVILPVTSLSAEAQTARRPAAMEARLKAKLAAEEKRLGPEHPDLAPALVELANFYRYWRRFKEAETLLKRALAIQEKRLGPNDPKIAATLGALATVYKAQGRASDAEAATKRAQVPAPKRAVAAKSEEVSKDSAKEKPGLARDRVDDETGARGAKPEAPREPAPVANPELPDGDLSLPRRGAFKDPPAPATVEEPMPPPPPPPPAAYKRKNGEPAPAANQPAAEGRQALDGVRRDEAGEEEPVREQPIRREDRARESATPKSAARNGGAASTAPATESGWATGGYGGAAPATRGAPAGSSLPAATAAPAPTAPAPTPPAATATESKPDYDVVPVFFGTDRKIESDPKRIRFGADRARALHIGHALVTVPADHKVPQVERPWGVTIPYWNITVWEQAEDPKKHFTIKEIATLSKPEFLRLAREGLAKSKAFESHAVVFVHGFNTTFDNALYRTAQIAYDLHFDGVPFLYSWPSAGDVTAYTSDRERAEQSKRFMAEFMQLVINETGAKTVSVIAHSMGNLPLLDVLKDLRNAKPGSVVISQVILAAPDVDRNSFEDLVVAFKGLSKGVTLYAASNDRALQISRSIWGEPRAGDVPADGPLVMADVDTIDVTAASTDSLSLNHSGYATHNALLNDIALLIRTGERPPHLRFPILKRLPTAKGDYWQYPGSQ